MPPNTVRAAGRKVQRQAILYDNDLGNQELIRVDLTISDGTNNIITPVTPTYQARFTNDNPSALPKREFEPRTCFCCFSPDDVSEVQRRVYNPYIPSNPSFIVLINELLNYQDLLGVEYHGESKEKGFENLL